MKKKTNKKRGSAKIVGGGFPPFNYAVKNFLTTAYMMVDDDIEDVVVIRSGKLYQFSLAAVKKPNKL